MPSLQQFDSTDCISKNLRNVSGGPGPDILRKHSINSILKQSRQDLLGRPNELKEAILSPINGDTIGITDILGLGKSTSNGFLLRTSNGEISLSSPLMASNAYTLRYVGDNFTISEEDLRNNSNWYHYTAIIVKYAELQTIKI